MFFKEDKNLNEALLLFKSGRSHSAVVESIVEDCGNHDEPTRVETVGIITIEDIMEEILDSEIVDETDRFVDVNNEVPVDSRPAFSDGLLMRFKSTGDEGEEDQPLFIAPDSSNMPAQVEDPLKAAMTTLSQILGQELGGMAISKEVQARQTDSWGQNWSVALNGVVNVQVPDETTPTWYIKGKYQFVGNFSASFFLGVESESVMTKKLVFDQKVRGF